MPHSTGRNVYLIRHNTDHLDGEYLVRAVVIANGPGRAVKALLRHVRSQCPGAIAQRSRLTMVQIGENAPDQLAPDTGVCPDEQAAVVAVVYGKPNDA
jgi:hypothetical protein